MTALTAPNAADAFALHAETEREVLPNGLTLLVRRDRSAPVVAIVTHVKTGYFDETDDVVGIAHVLEHMYFKGTPTRGVGQIARETKANGGYLNAHTIYNHTSYFTVLPSAAVVQGLEIQFDAYARSTIDREELAREVEVIVQEVKRKRDSPHAVAVESLYALLYDRHRIRRWRMGEEAALRTLSRDQVLAFYRNWYRPSNTILAIVGDVDPEQVRREVHARHGTLAAGVPVRAHGPTELASPGFRTREWSGDIAQQQIAFGWRTPALTNSDTPALDLAGIALGTGRASRLYRAVREHQWASSVTAWNYTSGDVGAFVVHAESPSPHAANAAAAMWREVQSARLHGLRANEVLRAQRFFETRWLRRLETMEGQASYLATWEADGGLELASAYYDRVLSLSAGSMQDVLGRRLDPSEVSVLSYRPNGRAMLAPDSESLRMMLRATEGSDSSVVPAAVAPTPILQPSPQAPAVHAGVAFEAIQQGVHVYRTVHGVPILILPRPGALLANVGVFLRGGGVSEADGPEGMARLTAHSMLKGTQSRSGARIAEDGEELGSSISVNAALESLGWTLSVPTRRLGRAATLLADVLQHPVFPDDHVLTERALAIAEVARLRDDMFRWPMRLASEAAFAGHPYARSVIGTEQSLMAIDAAALRTFHRDRVAVGDLVIAVVGDVQPLAVAELLAQHFRSLRWQAHEIGGEFTWPAAAITRHDVREKQQTALALLFPGPARADVGRFTSHVLSAITSGLGGRFFEQLRDKQSLAYTVLAYSIERRHAGTFAAYIATSPAREDEARAGLLREFATLCESAPTGDEVERARRYLVGTHQISQQSGAGVLGAMVDAWLLGGGLHELGEFEQRIRGVSAADILALSRRYFDPARCVEGIVRGMSAPPNDGHRGHPVHTG